MQDLSYIPVNREYHLDEYCFTISIYTFSNVYTIPEDACVIEHEGSLTAESTQLLWAGGQERVNGKFRLCARKTSAGIRIRIFAEMERSVDVITGSSCLSCIWKKERSLTALTLPGEISEKAAC